MGNQMRRAPKILSEMDGHDWEYLGYVVKIHHIDGVPEVCLCDGDCEGLWMSNDNFSFLYWAFPTLHAYL